jgi:hypothetical protein
MWILRHYATFKLESSLISPVQDPIHQWYSLSQHLHHSPNKVRALGRSDLLKKDSTRFFHIHHRRSRRHRRGEVRRKLHLGIPLPLWRVLTCGLNKCKRSVLPAYR